MAAFNHHTQAVETWLSNQPLHLRILLNDVRGFLLEWPLTEWYKYRLPMYGLKNNICYLHVDGKTQKPYIGFMNGKEMQAQYKTFAPHLDGQQKRVRQYWLPSKAKYPILQDLMEKAVLLDE